MFHQVDEANITSFSRCRIKRKSAITKDGLDTRIGEGEMLSGGQMRRIELSRILLGRQTY